MKQHTVATQVKPARGFTLIELMIVIAIIGIMSTFALPSWQERVIRSQVEEGIRMVSVIQEAQAAYWRKNGRLAASNAALGLPEPDKFIGNFVRRVEVADGAIHITYGNRINRNALDKVLTLRPAVVKDSPIVPLAWVCAQASVPQGMEAQGANRTDLPRWFLPLDCLS